MPDCYIIAGPNGAGKTTFAREFLPHYAHCVNFINPDLIAGGLSPFAPDLALARAGRIVLEEIQNRIDAREDFAFETTLSGRTYLKQVQRLRIIGYGVHMVYLWIPSAEMAIERVRDRVESGGHNVPELAVRRRYTRTLRNLFTLYRPHLDSLHFFDNSTDKPQLVFHDNHATTTVVDRALYERIIESAGERK